jgi:hypothetical protein
MVCQVTINQNPRFIKERGSFQKQLRWKAQRRTALSKAKHNKTGIYELIKDGVTLILIGNDKGDTSEIIWDPSDSHGDAIAYANALHPECNFFQVLATVFVPACTPTRSFGKGYKSFKTTITREHTRQLYAKAGIYDNKTALEDAKGV